MARSKRVNDGLPGSPSAMIPQREDRNSKCDEEAARILEETQHWYDSRVEAPGKRVQIEPASIERTNKALSGTFMPWDPDALEHPVLLVLSEVVAMRKRLDQNERLIRFLVERSSPTR